MKSSASSRANSLLVSTIPTWARLYYGSGERRLLSRDGRPASSVEGSHSRMNSFRSGSPNTDHFPLSIYSPRRRPREHQGEDTRNSLEIHQNPRRDSRGRIVNEREGARGRQRLRTWSMGSIWSPHLRHDRRATRRSVWVPPSVTWSTEGKAFGRRNIQVVMFIGGFLFPFGMSRFSPPASLSLFHFSKRLSETSCCKANNFVVPTETFINLASNSLDASSPSSPSSEPNIRNARTRRW